MTPRQQNPLPNSSLPKSSLLGEWSFLKISLPLLGAGLTIIALLSGAGDGVVVAICAAVAILCSVNAWFSAKPLTLPEPTKKLHTDDLPKQNTFAPQPVTLATTSARKEEYLQNEQMIDVINNVTDIVIDDMDQRLGLVNTNIEAVATLLHEQSNSQRKLQTVQTSLNRPSLSITKLANFSTQRDWQPQLLDIRTHLLANSDLILQSLLSESINLTVDAAPSLWTVKGDPDQFQMAIVNLVLNSREAMPRGGTISLLAKNVVCSDTERQLFGDFVAITVSDSGKGIAPEHLTKVFQPFFTTKRTRSSLGLGLPQVKTFALRMNGGVTIESTPDAGTSVTLYLPKAKDQSSLRKEPDQPDENRKASLLIALPHKEDIAELESLASKMGFWVETATDPIAALTMIRATRPSLVITDISMPGTLEGVPLGRQLHHRLLNGPVILIADNPAIATDHPDFTVLLKPLTKEKFSMAVNRYLRQETMKEDCL